LYSSQFALLPLLLFGNWYGFLGFSIAYTTKIFLGYFFEKRIGGYTGDCLGATQQVAEVVFYLSMLAILP
jgi:adenosylcobinamide-GDP ribazoletransferase